ncbi:MAG: hisA/hisF family protein [Planctomycetia bacterium]|nr:hisA/hisF family protein [Planctomycetia bacterium]
MKVIPVIDLKDGVVVRGVAGRRELYQPVKSLLSCQASPSSVAAAFVRHFGFDTVYVADLDAIAGAEPNWQAYNAIAATGLRLILDAGTNSIARASRIIDNSPTCGGIVIGLESLQSAQDLLGLHAAIGAERAVFSLDLRNGKPLTNIPGWSESKPIELVDAAADGGIHRLIVLDLASVGVGEGVSVGSLCTAVRCRHPQLEITAGGGVRGISDLLGLAAAGCDAVLVASALHDGRLSVADIAGLL